MTKDSRLDILPIKEAPSRPAKFKRSRHINNPKMDKVAKAYEEAKAKDFKPKKKYNRNKFLTKTAKKPKFTNQNTSNDLEQCNYDSPLKQSETPSKVSECNNSAIKPMLSFKAVDKNTSDMSSSLPKHTNDDGNPTTVVTTVQAKEVMKELLSGNTQAAKVEDDQSQITVVPDGPSVDKFYKTAQNLNQGLYTSVKCMDMKQSKSFLVSNL